MKKALIASLAAALLAVPLAAQASSSSAAPASSTPPAASADPGADPHQGHGPGDGHKHGPPPAHMDPSLQKEMNSMSEARLEGLAAYLRAKVDGASDRDALRASKLTLQEIDSLAFLSLNYYPARARALDFEAELARLSVEPPTQARSRQERLLKQKLDAHERFRSQFFEQIKQENRAFIDRYEPTFVSLVNALKAKEEQRLAEAIAQVQASFDETLLPRLMTYLSARAAMKPEKEALAAAKLDEKQVFGLSHLITDYSRQRATAQRASDEIPKARERLAAAKAQNKSAPFEERLIQHYESELAEFARFKKDFAQKNGEKLQAAIEANFDALLAAYQKEAAASAAHGEE
ncbi:MAG: hypothetical protein LBM75_07600 [Myxococcales bacterium]|nr:hypothetical protein [Myxococcales bacterium]